MLQGCKNVPGDQESLRLCCRTDLLTSMLPTYRMLLDYDLSILVFSGDVDAIVPVSSKSAEHSSTHAASMICAVLLM